MYNGTWLLYSLNDYAIPLQGVYIIESCGVVFHTGQTDNGERRRSEHSRDRTCIPELNSNFHFLPVADARLLDGIEAYLGKVLRAPTDKKYPTASEIPCNLPEFLPVTALATGPMNSLWDWSTPSNPMYPAASNALGAFGYSPTPPEGLNGLLSRLLRNT